MAALVKLAVRDQEPRESAALLPVNGLDGDIEFLFVMPCRLGAGVVPVSSGAAVRR
jgi:hypothetical protein